MDDNEKQEKLPKNTKGKRSTVRFDPITRKRFLKYIRLGYTRGQAARIVGLHQSSLWIYCKNHPEFVPSINDAILAGDESIADRAEEALSSLVNDKHFGAICMTLFNRRSHRWADKRAAAIINEVLPSKQELLNRLEQLIGKKSKKTD